MNNYQRPGVQNGVVQRKRGNLNYGLNREEKKSNLKRHPNYSKRTINSQKTR